MKHQHIYKLIICLLAFSGCKDADNFYEKLGDIPQISNETAYRYLPAYGVGDSLIIYGKLYPDAGMRITVGDVDNVPVARRDSVKTNGNDPIWIDRIAVLITAEMGIGESRPVTVTANNYTTKGASIQIYGLGGEGSVEREQKLELLATATSRQNVYFHCINGKGDIYYYGFSDKALYHLSKDGTLTQLLSAAQLQTDQNGTFSISNVAAGGVDPQGKTAYISLLAGSEYRFCRVDLQTKQVTTLNRTTGATAAPYEGDIDQLKVVFSGVHPADDGQVYLFVGTPATGTNGANADASVQAIARYSQSTGKVEYLFRIGSAPQAMPGTAIAINTGGYNLRLNATDGTLYVFTRKVVLYNGEMVYPYGLDEYQLRTGAKTGNFVPYSLTGGSLIHLGPMKYLRMNLVRNAQSNTFTDDNFGMLPLPNRRLLFLYDPEGENVAKFPKWQVADFANNNLYQWAPGVFDFAGYYFSPQDDNNSARIDQLLNYDEQGQLYMTASARASIVKTVFK